MKAKDILDLISEMAYGDLNSRDIQLLSKAIQDGKPTTILLHSFEAPKNKIIVKTNEKEDLIFVIDPNISEKGVHEVIKKIAGRLGHKHAVSKMSGKIYVTVFDAYKSDKRGRKKAA